MNQHLILAGWRRWTGERWSLTRMCGRTNREGCDNPLWTRWAVKGALIGAALAVAIGIFAGIAIVVFDPRFSARYVFDVCNGTVVGAVVFGGLGFIAGHVTACYAKPSSIQHPLTIPPDLEAIARERFSAPGRADGDTGPQNGVKRDGEVRGEG